MNFHVVLEDKAPQTRMVKNENGRIVLTAGASSYVLHASFMTDGADVHVLIGRYSSLSYNVTFAFHANTSLCTANYDFETELCYNRFRYYSPETGAYISQDPIRLNGNNPNLYAYVGNCNWWIDVFGLDCNQLNLDTGTVRTLLDGSTDEVDKMINNRDLVISETAMKEARAYAERSNRLEELDKLLIDKNITMIPDNPSERAKKLKPTKKLQENDIVIFGLVIIWEYKP